MLLTNLKKNEIGIISEINFKSDEIKKRLFDLGFVKGTKIKMIEIGLMKWQYVIKIRGYLLCMRKNLAEKIVVNK